MFERSPSWPTLAIAASAALAGAVRAAPGSWCETGRRQSPVDIADTRLSPLPPLQPQYRPVALRAVNDGHTVRVRFAPGQFVRVGADRLSLQQFHFHVPGGDKVRGEAFAMAMHFVHKSGAGQLVTLVLPFRLGAGHPVLAALLRALPSRGQPERRVASETVDAAQFLPRTLGYYRYEGSLTGPPCTEGVRWIVLKQPQELSVAQLARLRELFPDNARAVQPLNGRVVLESP